ncbi:MAG: hypothetical protein LHW57_03725 [Candidatus Cloacimonetes bacterium]|nr:hypothetical protein [Candidatus Cloacimonadota bacterium]
MKKHIPILLITVLGMAVLLVSSCTKPTAPNFEEYGIPANVWDYENVLWFELDYVEPTKGIANVEIWMSSKGVDPAATLKIGTQTIEFDEVDSYTAGVIYYGGHYSLNTDQPVTYEIVDGEREHTGSISILPKQVMVTTWPEFNPTTNYSPTWSIATDPQLHVIDAGAYGSETDFELLREIPGTQKTYTMLQSSWEPYLPIEEFYFGVNAIGYEMLNKNKVLIAGVSYNYYDWTLPPEDKENRPERQREPFRFMDQIQEDISK